MRLRLHRNIKPRIPVDAQLLTIKVVNDAAEKTSELYSHYATIITENEEQ